MEEIPDHFLSQENTYTGTTNSDKLWDFTHKVCFELSKNTKEISFFSIPETWHYSYCGIADFLQNNYEKMWDELLQIIRILEDKENFSHFIESVVLENWVNVFIGEENVIPFLKNYTIIVKKTKLNGKIWYVWIIWSLKMDYNFNISAIKWII